MKLQTLPLLLSLSGLLLASACGNKGDLYLIPDELSEQELLRLQQSLNALDVEQTGTDSVQANDELGAKGGEIDEEQNASEDDKEKDSTKK